MLGYVEFGLLRYMFIRRESKKYEREIDSGRNNIEEM